MQQIQQTDPLYIQAASQVAALNGHTHNGSDSLQLEPKWFHGWPITTVAPTAGLEEGSIILYNSGTHKLYSMIGQIWRTLSFDSSFTVAPWGSGVDGAIIFDGSTTILGLVPSSSIYTMTRDIFATTLVVNSGVTVKENGFKLYASTSSVVSGTISVAGGNGGTGSAGQSLTSPGSGTGGGGGTAGVGIPLGTLKQPGNGNAGNAGCNGDVLAINTKNGTAGGAEINDILSTNSAAGGDSGKGNINAGTGSTDNHSTGGALGTATRTTSPHSSFTVLSMVNELGGIGCNPTPGSGAGGGSGAGTQAAADTWGGGGGGGGSGAPGGILWIASPSITVSATGLLTANGGNGGAGGAGGTCSGATGTGGNYGGGGGGGGGGGNGGLILLATPSYTNNGSVTVTGGTGGSGGSGNTGGTNGNAGGNGSSGLVQQISP